MTDGVLINNGTVTAVVYGYQPEFVVPTGQTLVAMPSVAGIEPGSVYVPAVKDDAAKIP